MLPNVVFAKVYLSKLVSLILFSICGIVLIDNLLDRLLLKFRDSGFFSGLFLGLDLLANLAVDRKAVLRSFGDRH